MPSQGSARPVGIRRFLTFGLGSRLYALPAEDVAQVIRVPKVSRVPQSPPALLGIANLRGAVLPVVSLARLLQTAAGDKEAEAQTAIVLDGAAPVALVVETVQSLVVTDEDRIEVREAELAAEPGERLLGAFKADGERGVVKILDIKPLLNAAFEQRTRRSSTVPMVKATAAERLALKAEASVTLVTFEVAGQEFALDLDAVDEILPIPAAFTLVPRTEALVLGVTSVRERLLPLLSLRGLLGFSPAPAGSDKEKVVVTRVAGAQVGLVADRARSVLDAPSRMIDEIPPVLAARAGGEARIKAIFRGQSGQRLISILAPEQLFRGDVMQRLGNAARDDVSARAGGERLLERHDELQFLVFRLGPDEFALPIDAVVEVGQVPSRITRVPKTPDFLEGVVNLRGEVLPVLDQRRRFDMPAATGQQMKGRRLIVVRTERVRAGVIVDSVSDVLRVAAGSVEPAPDLTEKTGRLVRSVINLEKAQRILLVLDPTELLTPSERTLLETFAQSAAQSVGKSAQADA